VCSLNYILKQVRHKPIYRPLILPKKEGKPHSKGEFIFFLNHTYGLWGASIKLTASNITANKGINTKKKVGAIIITANLSHRSVSNIDNSILKVNINIVIVK